MLDDKETEKKMDFDSKSDVGSENTTPALSGTADESLSYEKKMESKKKSKY